MRVSAIHLLVGVVGALKYYPNHDAFSDELINYVNNEAKTTWTAGKNFAKRGMTVEGLKRMCGTQLHSSHYTLPYRTPHKIEAGSIPAQFDARKMWPKCKSISTIRDQGNCGSCWAVAATQAMSDRICISSNFTKQPRISGENLLACCWPSGMGCAGGYIPVAWMCWMEQGIVTGGPYGTHTGCQAYSIMPCDRSVNGTSKRPKCKGEGVTPKCSKKCDPAYKTPYAKDKWYGKSAYAIEEEVPQIQKEIMTHGPVEGALSMYADLASYKSGVYQHVTGGLLGGHAIKIIGWGTQKGTPYWLIANTWNYDWGLNGYFKILRGKNECGIESSAFGGLPRLGKDY